MKVSELVELLLDKDPDAEVVLTGYYGAEGDVLDVLRGDEGVILVTDLCTG